MRRRITGPGRPRKDTTFLGAAAIEKLEADRAYQHARHNRIREEAFEYLGGVCVACGTADYLDFHHIIPEAKSFTIGRNLSRDWYVLSAELGKCELRCRECHIDHHVKMGDVAAARTLRSAWKRFLFNRQPTEA